MGALITKNISGTDGSQICGHRYRIKRNLLLNDNCSGSLWNKYYISGFRSSGGPIFKDLDPKNCFITVNQVYSGYNVPDVGAFTDIVGTVIIDDEIYQGVILSEIFVENFEPHEECLLDTGEIEEYDPITIPVTRQSREDLLRNYKILSLLLNPDLSRLLHNQTAEVGNNIVDIILEDASETELLYEIYKIYGSLTKTEVNVEHLQYEDEIFNDEPLIKEVP